MRAQSTCPFCLSVAVLGLGLALAGCPRGPVSVPPEIPEEPQPPGPEAIKSFDAAMLAFQQAAEGGWERAECERVAGELEALSKRHGGVPAAIYNAGMVWRACDDHEQARQQFQAAGEFAPALVHLGAYAIQGKNYPVARRYFERARKADRRSAEAYDWIGRLHREKGQWAESSLSLRRALAVNSDSISAFSQMALLYLDIADENHQMLETTVLVCQQAAARAGQIKADPTVVASLHNTWGLALIRQGKVVGAVEHFDTARNLDPGFFEAHMNYGAVNLSFRGFEAAEQAFSKAVQLQPHDYGAQLSQGVALRGLGRYDEAQRAYEKARSLDPDAPGAYYNLGVLSQDYRLADSGDFDAQIELLGKATEVYRSFLGRCESQPEACVRKRLGQDPEDMRTVARRRIKGCEETIEGLREAKSLTAEGTP